MITSDSTFTQILQTDICQRLFKYFIFDADGNWAKNLSQNNLSLKALQETNPTWNAEDMAYGLNALISQKDHEIEFSVYDEQECLICPDKAQVKLFYFKANEKTALHKTAILAAGGAYGAVCSLVEAFPVAAKLAEIGVDSFCLNYRVGAPGPLFPKPMDDMAAAVGFLKENARAIGINMEDYAVGGFSAGGHLVSCFGTKERGYAHYNLSRPSLLMLNYPMTDIWANISPLGEPVRRVMLGGYFGENYSKALADSYNPALLCDTDYPPCFIAHAEDDTTVPIVFSEIFVKKLTQNQVKTQFFRAKCGSHGYGLGTFSGAAGWVEKAVSFWDKDLKK